MMGTPEWVKNAKVGDKVSCVDTSNFGHFVPDLQGGEILTLSFIEDGVDYIAVEFFEYPNKRYCPSRFKPLQSRPTDISIFTEILNKPHVSISEDA